MKNLINIVASAAIIIGIAACQKDGVFNPKKKIVEIYSSFETTIVTDVPDTEPDIRIGEKHLDQVWTWNKNLLKSIEEKHYFIINQNGTITYEPQKSAFFYFDYIGKQLSQVKYESFDKKSTKIYKYIYNKSKINQIETFFNDRSIYVIKFEHKDNKISKITYISKKEDLEDDAKLFSSPALQLILPEVICQQLITQESKNSVAKTAQETEYIFELTWEKNNLKEIKTYNAEKTNEKQVTVFEYDKKKNPFYQDFSGLGEESGVSPSLSANNIVKETTTFLGEQRSIRYKYSYKGDFPEEKTATEIFVDTFPFDDHTTTTTNRNTTYFKYN